MNEISSQALPTVSRGFVHTKEYRRFEEFCEACRRERYIGLCHGAPGVGKTVSARTVTRWSLIEGRDPFGRSDDASFELTHCRAVFITPRISNTPRSIRAQIDETMMLLRGVVGQAERAYAIDGAHRSDADCELVVVDEADRLSTNSLEELRDHYDRTGVGLIFVGMPGLEKRLARYPQLYSRIGFAHAFQPLSTEETLFVLRQHGEAWDQDWRDDDFTDQEALAAITRITGGNFRLIDRLMTQIIRIKRLNQLNTVTQEVVEAARECLIIGRM